MRLTSRSGFGCKHRLAAGAPSSAAVTARRLWLRPCAASSATAYMGAPAGPNHRSQTNAEACTTTATALLRWACHGWPGPDGSSNSSSSSSSSSPLRTPDPSASASAATATDAGTRRGPPQPNLPGALPVAVADLGPGRGRGLMATADVAPGETLLSVPLTRVFTSDHASELHWAAEMALRLLQARHSAEAAGTGAPGAAAAAAAAAAATNTSTVRDGRTSCQAQGVGRRQEGGEEETEEEAGDDGSPGPAGWGPWVHALPASVRTPLEYDDDEVRQLGCPYVQEEVRGMQQCVRDCYEVLQPQLEAIGCGWQDFLWAVQVFHSRCFFEPTSGRHMCVPGVDMANHSAVPNAAVRIVHSPGACQGYDALAEIAEPPPPEPSRFKLVAGDGGIRSGEEITISYGRWPTEAFLLLFGFVPQPPNVQGGTAAGAGGFLSPGDSLVLFRDAEEAIRWCLDKQKGGKHPAVDELRNRGGGVGDDERRLEAVLSDVQTGFPGDDLTNLVVMPGGVDGRLQAVFNIACDRLEIGFSPMDLLSQRLRERSLEFASGTEIVLDDVIGAFLERKRSLVEHLLMQVA